MRRQIIKWFLIWICACVIPIVGLMYFIAGLLPDSKFWQLVFLESLVFLNFIYLVIVFKKINPTLAAGFVSVFLFANFIYWRFSQEMDVRLQALQILAALIVINIIIYFVRKKSSPR